MQEIEYDVLNDVYTDAEVNTDLKTPRPGTVIWSETYKAHFRLLKNAEASSAITAQLACVAKATHKSSYYVIIAADDSSPCFGGVRAPGAASVPAGSWAWFQVDGQATFMSSGTITVANGGVYTKASVPGKVQGTGDGSALAAFAQAEAAVDTLSADVKASIMQCVFG